jgi:hypothetical protein
MVRELAFKESATSSRMILYLKHSREEEMTLISMQQHQKNVAEMQVGQWALPMES